MDMELDEGITPGGDWRTYRCPVCSHTDGVSLAGTESVLIRCSHCDTPLDVARKGEGGVAVTVFEGRSRRSKERA